jgi:hypothetical protein
MEEVHIPGVVEDTQADSTGVGIVSQRKRQCLNQWVPVLGYLIREKYYEWTAQSLKVFLVDAPWRSEARKLTCLKITVASCFNTSLAINALYCPQVTRSNGLADYIRRASIRSNLLGTRKSPFRNGFLTFL